MHISTNRERDAEEAEAVLFSESRRLVEVDKSSRLFRLEAADEES